jgi:hypothetical protein
MHLTLQATHVAETKAKHAIKSLKEYLRPGTGGYSFKLTQAIRAFTF